MLLSAARDQQPVFSQKIKAFGGKKATVAALICTFVLQHSIVMIKKTGTFIFRMLTSRIALNIYAWAFFIDVVYNNNRAAVLPEHSGHFIHIVIMHLVWFLMIYSNTLVLVPGLLLRRKYGWYVLLLLLNGILFAGITGWYSEWLLRTFPYTEKHFYISISMPDQKAFSAAWDYYANVLVGAVFPTHLFFTLGCLMQYFFKERRKNEQLEKKQLESELMLLKSQINPHFLFNVLNSIYSLSLKKSDEAPGVILKLSDILRYMLYESRQNFVPLDKELQMLKDYIAIEQIRLAGRDGITMEIAGDFSKGYIAPAMLISFVENAVKHGLDSRTANAYMMVKVSVQGDDLHFYCCNNYLPRNAGNGHTSKVGGIGLDNVRKRLQLIYPGKHHLTIRNENNIFEVDLTLKLNAYDLSDN
jgi:hypothetical protein